MNSSYHPRCRLTALDRLQQRGEYPIRAIRSNLWPRNTRGDSRWLGGSFIVLPALVVALSFVRDPERKLQWMNLIAIVWITTAFFARYQGKSPFVGTLKGALAPMTDGSMLVLGNLLILVGSVSMLLARKENGYVAVNSSRR